MERMEALKRAVGKADVCELLACAFAFPSERVAEGLASGALADDAEACLRDAGVDGDVAREVADSLRAWQGLDALELHARMRVTYSRLYLAPGGHTPIFPYESAFLHVEKGVPGIPTLFRTPATLDVERQMHEAGVAAKNERKEPCDSVFEEFEFLSYLFAKQADALNRESDEEAADWQDRARRFITEHAQVWLPTFMERTQELAADEPYAALAALGLRVLRPRRSHRPGTHLSQGRTKSSALGRTRKVYGVTELCQTISRPARTRRGPGARPYPRRDRLA